MLSQAGLEQNQLSFDHTWLEGKEYRIRFVSRPTNPIQQEAYLGVFRCRCVIDRPGQRWAATVTLRNIECPVHCPETSKEIREALEKLAQKYKNLTGSARELYQKQQVTHSNGVVSADPGAAMDRARAARDSTREKGDGMRVVSEHNACGETPAEPIATTEELGWFSKLEVD